MLAVILSNHNILEIYFTPSSKKSKESGKNITMMKESRYDIVEKNRMCQQKLVKNPKSLG